MFIRVASAFAVQAVLVALLVALTDEPEVWTLVAATSFMLMGLLALVVHKAASVEMGATLAPVLRWFEAAGLLGLLVLLPVSFVVAFAKGRTALFAQTLATAPLSLFGSAGGEQSYSSSCVNGVCASYCCETATGSVKWTDCDPGCDSFPGVVGRATGGSCAAESDRPKKCTASGLTTADQTFSGCNQLPELGPVTCTCCTTAKGETYWDCNGDCSSNVTMEDVGFPVRGSNSACSAMSKIFCLTADVSNSDTADVVVNT